MKPPPTYINTSWVDYTDFQKKVLQNPEKYKSLGTMIRFYEGIGVLVKEKLIDLRFVSLLMAGDVKQFWEHVKPIMKLGERHGIILDWQVRQSISVKAF